MKHEIKLVRKKIIAVDFDGTLHTGTNYPFIGEPNVWLLEWIRDHRHKYCFILHTCRKEKQLDYAIEWLKEQGIVFDFINENTPLNIAEYGDCRKIFADYYIDSNAYTPEAFLKMMGS